MPNPPSPSQKEVRTRPRKTRRRPSRQEQTEAVIAGMGWALARPSKQLNTRNAAGCGEKMRLWMHVRGRRRSRFQRTLQGGDRVRTPVRDGANHGVVSGVERVNGRGRSQLPYRTACPDGQKRVDADAASLSFAVTVEIKARKVKVTGPRGVLNKSFTHMTIDIFKADDKTIKVNSLPPPQRWLSRLGRWVRRGSRQGARLEAGCCRRVVGRLERGSNGQEECWAGRTCVDKKRGSFCGLWSLWRWHHPNQISTGVGKQSSGRFCRVCIIFARSSA